MARFDDTDEAFTRRLHHAPEWGSARTPRATVEVFVRVTRETERAVLLQLRVVSRIAAAFPHLGVQSPFLAETWFPKSAVVSGNLAVSTRRRKITVARDLMDEKLGKINATLPPALDPEGLKAHILSR